MITHPVAETVEHLDFTPTCQAERCQAGHPPAEWILVLTLPCCQTRVPKLACDPCKDRNLTAYKAPLTRECHSCGTVTVDAVLADHIEVLPLRGER